MAKDYYKATWEHWAAPGTLWAFLQLVWVPVLTWSELRGISSSPGHLPPSWSPGIYPAQEVGSDWIGLPLYNTQLYCRAQIFYVSLSDLVCLVSAIPFGLGIITPEVEIGIWESCRWLEPGRRNNMNRGTNCCIEHVLGNIKQFTLSEKCFSVRGSLNF